MVTVASSCFAGALCVCLVLGHFASAAPPVNNYEGLRELYQQLLEAGAVGAAAGPGEGYDQGPAPVGLLSLLGGSAGAGAGAGGGAGPAGLPLTNHQLVRKSNRTPSLRLRYGRRSDPAMKSSCFDGPVDES